MHSLNTISNNRIKEIVKYLKEHSSAIISIDTLEDYYYDEQLFPEGNEGPDPADE